MSTVTGLEHPQVVAALKAAYAFDGGAEREHNGSENGIGFGLLHYALVRNLRPDFALAIGSRYGFIPACIALGLKANGKGRLHFVDANYDDQKDAFAKAYGGTGHWSAPKEQLFGTLELHAWIDLFIERTDSFFPRSTVHYGYIYIDGNHSYQGIEYDFSHALKRLTPGGFISVHDALVDGINSAAPTEPGGFGIKEYVREHFPQALVMGQWPGLAVIQPCSPLQEAQSSQANHHSKPSGANGTLDLEGTLWDLSAQNKQLRELLQEQEAKSQAFANKIEELTRITAELKSAMTEGTEKLMRQDAYYELIARIRNTVQQALPPNATVIVASKGDDQLVSFSPQRGWHFPRTADGLYSGEHPADSTQAIAALENQRRLGAQYLLFPQTSFWWLDSYPEFRDYLNKKYPTVLRREDTCAIFALSKPG